jgi:hypothetical protein
MVASVICSVASRTPPPATLPNHVPNAAVGKRRHCRNAEFRCRILPPDRARVRRDDACATGRPPRRVRKRSKYAHSSSVISPRITAVPGKEQPWINSRFLPQQLLAARPGRSSLYTSNRSGGSARSTRSPAGCAGHISILPPCRLIMSRAIESPRPKPPPLLP